MRTAFFDSRSYDRAAFTAANTKHGHKISFLEPRLTITTAELARGAEAVCAFVNDHLDEEVLSKLKDVGVRVIALRSAGYNHVDLGAAAKFGLPVVRVPEYSPYAVAEHAIGLVMTLNRKFHRAFVRVHDLNFSLEGLVGFDLHQRTVGVIGTGKIGVAFCRILRGFGCRILAFDPKRDPDLENNVGVRYVSLEELCELSDVISLHAPLLPSTYHMINEATIARMRPGVMLINTSRGGLVDTRALVEGLKCGRIGCAGLDVYEEEEGVFFQDLSEQVLQDDVLARLLSFPNVLITAHQGFLTREALGNIAETTLASLDAFEKGEPLIHQVHIAP